MARERGHPEGRNPPGAFLPARPRRVAPPPRAHDSPDRTIQPVCTVQPPGTSGVSPAGTLVTVRADIWMSPSVTVPLEHSTTAVFDGASSVAAVVAGKPQLESPSAAAPSATVPTRSCQRRPWFLLSRLAISGCPFWEQTTGPPEDSRSGVGPVSLWLPASSSDQFGARGSMPPRGWWLCCSNPWLLVRVSCWIPSPATTSGNETTDSGIRQPDQDGMWRTSHTLERWRRPERGRKRGRKRGRCRP